MAQIVQNTRDWGQGLAASLSQLADRKIQQLDQRSARNDRLKSLTGTGNLTRQQAEFIDALPEKNQWEAAQVLSQKQGGQPTPEQNDQAGIPQQMSGLQEYLKQIQPSSNLTYGRQSPMDILQQALGSEQTQKNPMGIEQVLSRLLGQQQQQQIPQLQQAQLQEQALQRQEQEYPQKQQRPVAPQPNKFPLGIPKSYDAERRHQETLDLRRQQIEATREDATANALEPFIKGHREDVKTAAETKKIATRMLKNLRENRERFPTGLIGRFTPEQLRTDPHLRNYTRDANNLVLLKAGARKGQPTNYKVKLEQLGKIDLTQPIESQEEGLINIINDANEIETRNHIFDDIRTKNKGRLPRDIALQIDERIKAQNALPGQDRRFEEGSQWQTDDGHLFEYQNGSWVPVD